MEIVEPKVEVWLQNNIYDHIARCARICYASVPKSTGNEGFCSALWANKHRSMFRHASVYYITPDISKVNKKAFLGANYVFVNGKYYVSTNAQSAKEYWDKYYSSYKISIAEAETNIIFKKYKLLRYTLCIDTSIDITREFNRKSPNNIAEQSTRYVDFNKKLGIRFKQCHWMYNMSIWKYCLTRIMLKTCELFYKIARSKHGLNLPPQDARFILPLNTMSKVVYTYTIAEWEYIINMRLWDWTGKAHPDAKIIGQLIYDKFKMLGYNIKNYKEQDDTKASFI